MPYLVHSEADRRRMLDRIGAGSMEDLLAPVPAGVRIDGLDLPPGLSELEAMSEIQGLAAANRTFPARLTFRGGGVYRRFIPTAVAAVTGKPEFYTAYTPYQPEASQGWLQAIFEFQTLIAELTAMDVANASLYDGATAVAEAAMMAAVHTGRSRVVVAGYLHPEYLEVLRCYADGRGIEVTRFGAAGGTVAVEEVAAALGPDVAALVVQQPNFLGLVEDTAGLAEAVHSVGGLLIACVDPVSLAILAPPGEQGADIAVGEGQQLGLPPSFGGPHVGFMACREALVRRLPGRLVGEAYDSLGRRGFVLTLTAREQHIRREKATSNICTNHALCALAATVYLTYMGDEGLRQVAEVSFRRAHHLAEALERAAGWVPAFPGAQYLNEFPLVVGDAPEAEQALLAAGLLGGLPVERWYPELRGVMTFTCTEVNDSGAIDQLVGAAAAARVAGVR